MSMMDVLVSIIICLFSSERIPYALQTVESVLKQSHRYLEVLIVCERDQLLVDALRKLLPSNVSLLVNQKSGLCVARNLGVRNAKGYIIAFLDDDATAHPEWISELIEEYRDPNVIGVGGKTIPVWVNRKPRWFPEELSWIIGCASNTYPKIKLKVRNLHGCNMSFRRYVFEKIGLFRENLGSHWGMPLGGEEAEFCAKVQSVLENSFFLYTPDALVFHKVIPNRGTLRYVVIRSYQEGRGKGVLRRCLPAEMDFSVEENYLNHLLRYVIPEKLARASKSYIEILKIGVIILSVISVFLGYVVSYSER